MIIKRNSRREETLDIYEVDIVNGGDILILTAYAVKENDEMWAFPSPQIFNVEIYERFKDKYDEEASKFRNNLNLDYTSLSGMELDIQSNRERLELVQIALDELLMGGV